jgi:hypothetical protein
MLINEEDTFPLWSFGYAKVPVYDRPNKIMTSRGRTWQEAWTCVQQIGRSFEEPEKVGLLATVAIQHKNEYSKTHPYDWLHDAPLWIKQAAGAHASIW